MAEVGASPYDSLEHDTRGFSAEAREHYMAQCAARTASGSRCVQKVASPSRNLCKQHQNVLARGSTVVNAETGRKFPKSR